ncbi:MAG: DUF1585 domain-containing protein, partial [Planctomycetota bacterium]|nr:DUF1585 domain-containing protein [Planctomycetota bacterium]
LTDKDQIARALTERLIIYATGSTPQPTDQPGIETIVTKIRTNNYGFKSLVHEITSSDFFLNK